MDINPLIIKRYSPRAFSDKPVSQNTINTLFEAAHLAPSSRNEQPWRFFYSTKDNAEAYKAYLSLLNDWNKQWAQSAPVLIAAVAKLNYEYKNVQNYHALYDLGQAVSYFTMQATYMGLFVHQMGGFYADMATQLFQLPMDMKLLQ